MEKGYNARFEITEK